MKMMMEGRRTFWIFLLILLSINSTFSQDKIKQRKVVFVIADGIPTDVIQNYPMPFLKKITQKGGLVPAYVGGEKGAYSETPTISAVGYNSLLTGTWVNKHNVWGNDITAPNYNYWNIFRILKSQFPDKKTAIFSTWEDNRTKLIGSNSKEAGNLQLDYVFDGYELDTVRFVHDKDGHFYNKIDNFVVEKACETVKKYAPDLSWIYLEYTDEMGHRHGDSPQFLKALSELDKQIGKLDEAINYREKNFQEEWLVIITTDHGRDTFGFHHGNQTNRERNTWMATNYGGMNEYFKKQQPAIVDIAPTILRFLGIEKNDDLSSKFFEMDGVPMIGELSAINLTAKLSDGKVNLHWIPIQEKGKAKIWLSTTNDFKTGKKEEYKLMKEVDIKDWQTTIDVSAMPSEFYKIVLEMPHNTLNLWIMK
jgi:predicted AlkP superfamily pyrophosphatase or phosphodiesterase